MATTDDSARDLRDLRDALRRKKRGFTEFSTAFSIVCILAGGITSFPLGLSSVGGAAIGLGWPLSCLFSICFALAMAQLASSFPTVGGHYHWSWILGNRGWGWFTAWFNLCGLLAVLAAINLGTYQFTLGWLGSVVGGSPSAFSSSAEAHQHAGVAIIILSQALLASASPRLTKTLIEFSWYLIACVSFILTASMIFGAASVDLSRLWTIANYSGRSGGDVWPATDSKARLFFLGMLLPAYTITGFDASVRNSSGTIDPEESMPVAITRSVGYACAFGWIMLAAIVLAIPKMDMVAAQGPYAFFTIMDTAVPPWQRTVLYVGISVAQYLCGLAALGSAAQLTSTVASEDGLPLSGVLRRLTTERVPGVATWAVAIIALAAAVCAREYSALTALCAILLYISYSLPVSLGLFEFGKKWTRMGPWSMGAKYRVVAAICLAGCVGLVSIGVQPPNDLVLWLLLGTGGTAVTVWYGHSRKNFKDSAGVVARHTRSDGGNG